MKWLLAIVVVIIISSGIWYFSRSPDADAESGIVPKQTISDGTLKFAYPKNFGLAVTPEQILSKSYIPACDPDFDYCFYYNGEEFTGTNFESAGIRIQKRPDLAGERLCLDTPPAGFDATKRPSGERSADSYSATIFSQIGNAGAGHYANGELYRIFVRANSACYDVETRIGESQFDNYPAGSIQKFDESDRDQIYTAFNLFFRNLTLTNGQSIALPESED